MHTPAQAGQDARTSPGAAARVGDALNPATRNPLRWAVILVALITLCGAIVRASFLDAPMRYDESWNYMKYVSLGPVHIMSHFGANNHVLHTLLTWASSQCFGTSPIALRLPAFVAGVALMPVTAWLAWNLFRDKGVVVLAAAAVCVSSPLIEYSCNARGYSLLAVLCMVSFICFMRLRLAPGSRRFWLVWGSIGALAAYTLPVMVYPMGIMCAIVVVEYISPGRSGGRNRDSIIGMAWGAALCGTATFLMYLPFLIHEGSERILLHVQYSTDLYREQSASFITMLAETWRAWNVDAHVLWQVAVGVGGLWFVLIASRRCRACCLPVLLMVVGPFILVAIQGVVLPARAWHFILPLFLTCVACGLCALVRNAALRFRSRLPVLGGVAIAILGIVLSGYRVTSHDRLSSEKGSLVDIGLVVDEIRTREQGPYSLFVRYTPSTWYYITESGLPAPASPGDREVRTLYLVTDAASGLDELWHEGMEGFASYRSARKLKTLPHCTIWVAERIDSHDAGLQRHGLGVRDVTG